MPGRLQYVTPHTYSRWVREQRQGRTPKSVGRPQIARNMRELVIRFARENATWGYRRIVGEMKKLRLIIGRSTVRTILKEEGLTPSPKRRGRAGETVWQQFIQAHVNTLVACDFFTKNVMTIFGKQTAYCLAFIHVGTRRVFVSPPTLHPHEVWVKQQARNMLLWLEDNGLKARFLVHDRDTKFSAAFRTLLRSAGVRSIRTPALAPDANAYIESWTGGCKREALDHFLCFSLGHLDHINQQYVRFFNEHRPHQGLGNLTIPNAAAGPPEVEPNLPPPTVGRVRCQQFLGGLLRHYDRAAA